MMTASTSSSSKSVRLVSRAYRGASEGVTARGGLFGASASDPAKAFVHMSGSEPVSVIKDIVRSVTKGGKAYTLSGTLPPEVYERIADDADLLYETMPHLPTVRGRVTQTATLARS